ncbi:MAG: hypothetical protein K2L24_01245 [Opitutales bacterium]|nr:hypothetical protein [Opitutales bacterium]
MVCVVFLLLLLLGAFGAIGMGTFRGRKKAMLARAEMIKIAHILENYRTAYGDYPWIAQHNAHQGKILCSALHGKILPDGSTPEIQTDRIDIALTEIEGALVNPFGNAYIYYYRLREDPDCWEYPSYILVSSKNADAPASVTEDGVILENSRTAGDLIITNGGFL